MKKETPLINEILNNWQQWDDEKRARKLADLWVHFRDFERKNHERVVLPDPLIQILIHNLDEESYFQLIFSSLRIFIYASHQWLLKYADTVMEKALKLLFYRMIPVSDSASWLLNIIGSKATWRLIEMARNLQGKQKAITIGVLGRNYLMAETHELSDASLQIFISALYDKDELVRLWGIYSLMENSPVYPGTRTKYKYPDWDFEFVYQQVRPVLIEYLQRKENGGNDIARRYLRLIEKRA